MKTSLIFAFGMALILPQTIISQELYSNQYQWKIPGGNYIDANSFFSLHGYVNAVYGSKSEEWKKGNMNAIGMPGQVLIPNTNKESFQTDEALWISSEISNKTSVLMEIHFVTAPSGSGAAGPGGLTLVLTEANGQFKLFKNYANIAAGIFWSPFGIHNNDWLGAQNLFTTIPYASCAFPTHYNEKGIRLDGFLGQNKFGLNYVFSIGNGFNAYDISGYQAVDNNNNKTFTGRISAFPYFQKKLNIGMSYANGEISAGDYSLDDTLLTNYSSNFESIGLDIIIDTYKNVKLRSYGILTRRNYYSPNNSTSTTLYGCMAEMSYSIELKKMKNIKSIVPKIRYDLGHVESFNGAQVTMDHFSSVSFGFNLFLNDHFYISSDYNILNESNEPLKNNRFITRLTANF